MRPQIVHILVLAVFLLNGMQSFAQSKGPPPPNPNRMTTPPPPIDLSMPIDDNIVILLVAGVLLGVYYLYTLRIAKKKTA